jgi:chromosomal replication initiation ATPase DnaA
VEINRSLSALAVGMNTWELIKQRLASKLSTEAFENWLARTKLLEQNVDTIAVAVPDEAAKVWIEKEYADHVRAAVAELNLGVRASRFTSAVTVMVTRMDRA